MADRRRTDREDYKDRKRKEAFDDLEFVVDDKSKGDYKAADAFDELERSKSKKKKKRRRRRIWPFVLIIIIVVIVILFLTYPKYAGALPGKLGNLPIMGNQVTKDVDDADGSDTEGTQADGSTDVIDQNISTLVTNYFSAYVTADFNSLPEYAYPVSGLEESYIQVAAEYVESYNDISCTRSDGPEDNSYFVTVTASVKFKNYETTVPQIHYFYIKMDDNSMYYIDNLYSDFNRTYMIAAMDSSIYTAFSEYLNTDSVKEAASSVSENKESVLSGHANLKTFYEEYESAVTSWESTNTKKITNKQQESGNDLTDARILNKVSDSSSVTETETSTTLYAKTRVNIRKKPNTNSKIVRTVNKNKTLKVIGETSNGWYKVKTSVGGKTYTGYVMAEYTKKNKPGTTSVTETEASGVRYAKTGVNIRSKASKSASVVTVVNKGKRFKVLAETSNGWYKVQFKKGSKTYTGYVLGEYTKKKK